MRCFSSAWRRVCQSWSSRWSRGWTASAPPCTRFTHPLPLELDQVAADGRLRGSRAGGRATPRSTNSWRSRIWRMRSCRPAPVHGLMPRASIAARTASVTSRTMASMSSVPPAPRRRRTAAAARPTITPGSRRRVSPQPARLRVEPRVGQAEALLDRAGDRPPSSAGIRVKGTPSCDAMRQRPAVGFQHLGVPLGVRHRVGPADDAVVAEQDGVVVLHERQHGLGELLRARRLVLRAGHAADEHVEFGNDGRGRHAADQGVGGRVRRMAVDDGLRLRLRPCKISRCRKISLVRGALRDELVALEVDQAQVLGPSGRPCCSSVGVQITSFGPMR